MAQQKPVLGICEQGGKHLGVCNNKDSSDQLSNYKLFKDDSTPYSYLCSG
jgi:hypothetical protein